MRLGVDYAWAPHPSVQALKAGGYSFAARYVSSDRSKDLTKAEAVTLSDAGIDLVVVYESTATRAADGFAAGVQDAHAAQAEAVACGMPADRPIYFAVDYDAEPPAIDAYFRGVGSVIGAARAGVYGGIRVVKQLLDSGLVRWAWQADAWSYGQWDPRANIRQTGSRNVGGADCDINEAMTADFGQWRVGQSPSQQPAQEDDMPYGQLADGPQAITPISLPRGKYKTLGLLGDNGLQGLPPAKVRVAVHSAAHGWHVDIHDIDSAKGQMVVVFPETDTDGISVRREDKGDVHVAYEVS